MGWTHRAISRFSQFFMTGVTKALISANPVCGVVYIKEPLLLIEKNNPCSEGQQVSSRYMNGALPYV